MPVIYKGLYGAWISHFQLLSLKSLVSKIARRPFGNLKNTNFL